MVRGVAPAAEFPKTPIGIAGDAPLLGEHSADVARDLGYTDAEIEELIASDVIGRGQSDWLAGAAAAVAKAAASKAAERG
jgi:hypothetical protein